MRKLFAGLPHYMRRNAEVHLAWIIIAAFVALIVTGCKETKAETPPYVSTTMMGPCVVYKMTQWNSYVLASPNCHVALR